MFFFGIIPKSKFNIYTTDLRVILSIIVATGVYTLLLKFLQKNSPYNVQTNIKISQSMNGSTIRKTV